MIATELKKYGGHVDSQEMDFQYLQMVWYFLVEPVDDGRDKIADF